MLAYALIAEPDAARASLIRRLLLAEGMAAAIVADGKAAISSVASRGAPSLVVTNLMLTGLDGFGLLAELRRTVPFDVCPAVAVSPFEELRQVAWNMRDRLGIAALLSTESSQETCRRALQAALVGTRALAPEGAPEPAPRTEHLDRIASMQIENDRPTDLALHRLVAETAQAFNVPIAVISIRIGDTPLFRAHVGLAPDLVAGRTAKDFSFFDRLSPSGEPFVVPDAAMHPLFAGNPLVRSGAVRSCAGAPIVTPEGEVIGSLGIVDTKPLAIRPRDVLALQALARRVSGELALREAPAAPTGEPSAAGTPIPSQVSVFPYMEAVLANLESGVLLTDPSRKVLLANRALSVLCGRPLDRASGMPRDAFIRTHMDLTDEPEAFLERIQIGSEGPTAAHQDFEVQRPARRWLRWIVRPVHIPDGVGQLELFTDITAEIDLEAERERLARTDALTGLANRRAGEEALAREVARARRSRQPVAVLLAGIDHLVEINRELGVGEGDKALRSAARALRDLALGPDLAIRWAGLELLGILPAMDMLEARRVAEALKAAVADIRVGAGRALTVSLGVAVLGPAEDQNATVARAKGALEAARSSGGDTIVVL